MKQKLIILNNGLRDHRGHYFETSISIAEAARGAGLHPVLATHAECRRDIFPDWLEVYPLFCTDHWMSGPPAQCPDLTGALTDPYGQTPLSVDDVRGGKATIQDFVSSRLPTSPDPAAGGQGPGYQLGPSWGSPRNGFRWGCAHACRRFAWCADRAFFYLLPPLVYDNFGYVSALLLRIGRFFAALGFHITPRILNVRYLPRLLDRVREIVGRVRASRTTRLDKPQHRKPQIATALENEVERPLVAEALQRMEAADMVRELENGLIFKRDLERLLALVGCTPNDHVVLGTAHGRELLAVRLLQQRLGVARSPQFHLEFRHPLFHGRPSEEQVNQSAEIGRQQTFFDVYQQWGPTNRISLYTDTKELSAEYTWLSHMNFGVLPIPFRTRLMNDKVANKTDPLTLTFLGDARDEKGFHLLPGLIDRLMDDYVRTGKIRFVLQATMSVPEYNAQSIAALSKLKDYPEEQVQLTGLDGPLTPEAYYDLISAADIVLLPYDRHRYGAASSGTLAEAIAAGRPAVVPADSWMSSQLPSQGGETFQDADSLAASLMKLIDHYPSYRRAAEAYRDTWLTDHTPEEFVAAIVGKDSPHAKQSSAAA